MLTPGKYAAEAMREFGVKGATDVTGFRSARPCVGDGAGKQSHDEIEPGTVPLLDGALELAAAGDGDQRRQNEP